MAAVRDTLEVVETLGNDVPPADVDEGLRFDGDGMVVGALGDLETSPILQGSADSDLGEDSLFCL